MAIFRCRWLIAGLLLAVTPGAFAQAPAWVSGETGETPDPAIHYRELPNGFRYAVMRNAEPKGVAVINYRVAVGTAEQGAGEKEFAHLIEHLAFGQTTAFPKDDAIAQLQAAGLQLGNDVNGFTTPRGTVYALSVPQVTGDRLALALRFLRGFSDGELFEANEIERQKGVVTARDRRRREPGRAGQPRLAPAALSRTPVLLGAARESHRVGPRGQHRPAARIS